MVNYIRLQPIGEPAVCIYLRNARMSTIEQHKLSARQRSIVLTVYLRAVQLIGKHYNSVLGGTAQAVAVGVVGELKVYSVGVSVKADYCVFVESGVVGYDDIIGRVVMSIKRLDILYGYRKCAVSHFTYLVQGICLRIKFIYICIGCFGNINVYAVSVQRQSIGKRIVENKHIFLISVYVLRNCGYQLKGNSVADVPVGHVVVASTISAVHISPRKLLVVYLLLHGGDVAVLRLHGHVAQHLDYVLGGGIFLALKGAVLILDEIVTGGEVSDDIITVYRLSCRSRNNSKMQRSYFRERGGIGGGGALGAESLSHVGSGGASTVLPVVSSLQRGKERDAVHARTPYDVAEHGAGLVAHLLCIAGNGAGEYLVCLVGVAGLVVGNGDRIYSLSREAGDRQCHGEHQREQYCPCASHFLHS